MKRHVCAPRPDWVRRVESIGLTYHSHESSPYWDESACYEFCASEIDVLERAANELHTLSIAAAEHIVTRGDWHRLGIPAAAVPLIENSWERDDFSIYGRFDLAYDGFSAPKLLEYNADTPTALVEAAVAQWYWLQELHPDADQFNSLHERLIAAWQRWAAAQTTSAQGQAPCLHFTHVANHPEDEQTILYLRDTALQAGLPSRTLAIQDLGWHSAAGRFVDLDDAPIDHLFKLYPWEWLFAETFAPHLSSDRTRWLEPPWKMLLSNKGLLPVLWELFPDHPNLLPAYETPEKLSGAFACKPKLSREGANISLHRADAVLEQTTGDYGAEGYIYQALAPIPDFAGNHPVCGVWIVDHAAAGLGIREDTRLITGNLSRFTPHFFRL